MKVTASPASRFGSEGQTVEYTVRVEGASEISAPAKSVEGLEVRVLETRSVGDALEARVAVDVIDPVFY